MRKVIVTLAAIVAFQAPALACSCAGPIGREQQREFAQEMARKVVALAEVTQIEPMNMHAMRPERFRVLRVIVGEAPEAFFAVTEFNRHSSGLVTVPMSSCDAAPGPGEHRIVALYAPSNAGDTGLPLPDCEIASRNAAARTSGTLEIGGMCTHLFLHSKGVIDLVRVEARRLGRRVN